MQMLERRRDVDREDDDLTRVGSVALYPHVERSIAAEPDAQTSI